MGEPPREEPSQVRTPFLEIAATPNNVTQEERRPSEEEQGEDEYEGQFAQNCVHGQGILRKANGDVYEGQWQNDKAHGYGSYVHVDGSSYAGEWVDDCKHGRG